MGDRQRFFFVFVFLFLREPTFSYCTNLIWFILSITCDFNLIFWSLSQDPGTAIPKGTLLSLLISMASYSLLALYSGLVAVRDASGDVTELASREYLNCKTRHCEYGLMNSYSVSTSKIAIVWFHCFPFFTVMHRSLWRPIPLFWWSRDISWTTYYDWKIQFLVRN